MNLTEIESIVKRAIVIIIDLIDEDDCYFDHHGYCQAHGWPDKGFTCPHARGKMLLKELKEDYGENKL